MSIKSNSKKITNSSNNSSDNDLENKIKRVAEGRNLEVEFLEKVSKYVKITDILEKKQEEQKEQLKNIKEQLKVVKETKTELETYILEYLDKKNEKFINIEGKCELIKTERITQGIVKEENIKDSVKEKMDKEKILNDSNQQREFIDDLLNIINNKREKKIKIFLKKKSVKTPKQNNKK
jgi:hypothetical protein